MIGALDPPTAAVRDAVGRALAEDLGPLGDITASLVPSSVRATCALVARKPGVLAGTACFVETYAQLGGAVRVEWMVDEGAELHPGARAAVVAGPLRAILTGERTALNFVCHLSGVATTTRRFVEAVGGRARVLDTRKTLPGLRALEKAAVRAGGGVNHRGSLSDLVLVKDNHRASLSIGEAVSSARTRWPGRGVEVECDGEDQVAEALAAGVDVVMLDNMTPEQVAKCVTIVRDSAVPRTLVEVSGGVTLDTVGAYAASGADMISTGAITQSAGALDLGLDVVIDEDPVPGE